MTSRMQCNLIISAIVATDVNGAIGRGMDIPWHCPDDLKRFRKLTLGHAVIMGHKTALSIGRALPNRCNIVLSRTASEAPFPGQILARTVAEALAHARAFIMENDDRLADPVVFVLGGGEIYRLFLPHYHALHLTTVHRCVEDANVFFPVQEFLETYGATNRLFFVKGDRRSVMDGKELTTYAHYEMHRESVPRMDLMTQNNLPWCVAAEVREGNTAE